VLVDSSGAVLEGAGEWQRPVYARSAVKSLQALPLVESGAAERYGYGDEELALALASHNAARVHTEVVRRVLERLGLGVEHLACGAQPPTDREARAELEARGEAPTALHNNCSGKHAGFLALALHLGVPPERYLDPDSASQQLVRRALLEMSGVADDELSVAIDGCSAPTFRLPLVGLATAFARVADPAGLAPERRRACEWMQRAVAAHPVLIAGEPGRLCTSVARASGGRLFPKIGAEGVYAIGAVGRDRALALKIDDGGRRALHALVVHLVERLGWLEGEALAELDGYRETPLRNWAGLEVGRTEVLA
jgi:L-asparaginase II